jgi:hypothetical protein
MEFLTAGEPFFTVLLRRAFSKITTRNLDYFRNRTLKHCAMETRMHKRVAIVSVSQFAISDAIASWFSQFRGWNEARELRKASRKRAEAMSQLAQILCDLGETSRRVRQSEGNNPFLLSIDGIMNRRSFEFDPRQYWDS